MLLQFEFKKFLSLILKLIRWLASHISSECSKLNYITFILTLFQNFWSNLIGLEFSHFCSTILDETLHILKSFLSVFWKQNFLLNKIEFSQKVLELDLYRVWSFIANKLRPFFKKDFDSFASHFLIDKKGYAREAIRENFHKVWSHLQAFIILDFLFDIFDFEAPNLV